MSDINKEIQEMSDKMEKSTRDSKEALFETIKRLGPNGLRKAMPNLDEKELELLKEAVNEMKKAAVEMDKEYDPKLKQSKITEAVFQEHKVDTEDDEKLVKEKAAKQNHQGDDTPEGRDKEVVIKSTDLVLKELKNSIEAVLKSLGLEYDSELIKSKMKMILKKEDKKEEVKKSVSTEDVQNVVLLEETEEPKKEEIVQKSISWGNPNDKITANTNGRNFHFNVNEYYSESMKKSDVKEEAPLSEIESIILAGNDTSLNKSEEINYLRSFELEMNKQELKSYSINDLAEVLNIDSKEAKELGIKKSEKKKSPKKDKKDMKKEDINDEVEALVVKKEEK